MVKIEMRDLKKTMALIATWISERMHILKTPFNTYYKFLDENVFFIVLLHCFAQQQMMRRRGMDHEIPKQK